MSMNRRKFFSILAGGVAAIAAIPKAFAKPGLAFHRDAFTMAPIDIRRKQIHWYDVLEAPKVHPYLDRPVAIGDILTVPGIFYPGTAIERMFMVTPEGQLHPAVILRKGSPYYNADVDTRLYEVIDWPEDTPKSGTAIVRGL